MEDKKILDTLSREELIELIGIYSKNWLAMDGFWFQSVERKFGMDEAMFHDVEIWKRFTVTEARRIKAFLGLEDHPGLEGLAKALQLRFYGNINKDMIGWLTVDGTAIDYPVMQTPSDEQFYLNRDFNGNYSAYGCIIADTDSTIGTGTLAEDYTDGTRPGTNIILHGHNMKNGTMFGSLDNFRDKAYEQSHSIIKFSSLYEDREYKICAVFL